MAIKTRKSSRELLLTTPYHVARTALFTAMETAMREAMDVDAGADLVAVAAPYRAQIDALEP